MKKYYINYYNDFGNTFDLCWVDTKEDEKAAIAKGYKRITRKEAIRKCVNSREEKRVNGYCYGSCEILNFNIAENLDINISDLWTDDGYIYE